LDAETHSSLFDRGYTYIALYVGRPQQIVINRQGQMTISQSAAECHVTIAYAPRMPEHSLQQLQRRLDTALSEWKHLPPSHRCLHPDVFHRRRFNVLMADRVSHREHTWAWHKTGICLRDEEELEMMLADDRIECVHYDEQEHGDKKDYFRKLYQRDRDRYEGHRARSEKLRVNNGWLVMKHKEILGGRMRLCQETCPEILDVLEYLGDWVYFFLPAQFQVTKNQTCKIFPPFVGTEKHWHCTRQGDWKGTTFFQTADQQHRHFFEAAHELQQHALQQR
jgi:hypothetical protein